MVVSDISMVEFISASTAGVVNVQLGYVPDAVILITDHGGTNPNARIWANNASFSGWAAALAVLITGSTGVFTRDTASVAAFAGNTKISTVETANSDPKHITEDGAFHPGDGTLTKPGITIPAGDQVNSGRNLLIAFRRNR